MTLIDGLVVIGRDVIGLAFTGETVQKLYGHVICFCKAGLVFLRHAEGSVPSLVRASEFYGSYNAFLSRAAANKIVFREFR